MVATAPPPTPTADPPDSPSSAANAARIETTNLCVAYGDREVLRDVSLSVAPGEMTVLIGPNGSGKSTLLRTLARLIRPAAGQVRFDGVDLASIGARELAQQVAYLPQAPEGPPDLTVDELVWRGRYPNRGFFASASTGDYEAVERALLQAGVATLRKRPLATLSGGEHQRAWVAMALAREPEVLLLDEPTSFLDIGHQSDLLELLAELNRERGITVVMVLHDVTQAAHYARRVVALRDGQVWHDGSPAEVVTAGHISGLFDAEVSVLIDPSSGAPVIVPRVWGKPGGDA